MAMQIVKMVQMKIRRYVTIGLVIQKLNFHVKMDVAYQNYGCAILIMIAAMIRTNQLICVDKRIVRLVGKDVQDDPIIVAYPNGYSAMVKMIVEMDPMNYQKIVHNVT